MRLLSCATCIALLRKVHCGIGGKIGVVENGHHRAGAILKSCLEESSEKTSHGDSDVIETAREKCSVVESI